MPPSTVFRTPLSDFAALIALREEALPHPDRAILGSVASTSTEDEEDDGLLSSKKARARLHSIPRGKFVSDISDVQESYWRTRSQLTRSQLLRLIHEHHRF